MGKNTNQKIYFSSELVKEYGITLRMLYYWLAKWGIKETSRIGIVRIYDAKKVHEIRQLVKAARKVGAFYKPRTREKLKQAALARVIELEIIKKNNIFKPVGLEPKRIRDDKTEMSHELKCWPKYFESIVHGKKTFEVRCDDRGYNIGDTLILREYDIDKKEYTRRQIRVRVTDMFNDFGLQPGWVVMSIEKI